MRRRTIPSIGYLSAGDPVSRGYRVQAFRQGLNELGYIEGKNIIIEYRYARANSDRLAELARELSVSRSTLYFGRKTSDRGC